MDEEVKADPVIRQRAANTRKAAEKAEADLAASVAEAAPAAGDQPKRSKRQVMQRVFNPKGAPVMMRITSKGRDHISTGGDSGFERWDKRAVVPMAEESAYSNWKKGYAEPEEDDVVEKFDQLLVAEQRREARAKAKFDDVMEHGARIGEEYRSDPVGPGGAPAVL